MAKTLRSYNWTKPSELTRTEKATYPWDDWLDGRIWKLIQGEDFYPHPLMMERIIRTRATGRGAKIRMRHEALNGDETNPFGVIVIQRTDIAPEAKTNGKPAPAKADAKAPSKAAAAKEKAVAKAPTKAAAKANGTRKAPAKKVAPAKAAASKKAAPVKRAPATRPRSIKVDGPAPAPSKTPAKKVSKKVPANA